MGGKSLKFRDVIKIIIFIIIFSPYQIIIAQTYTLSGFVQDAKTRESLIGVNIYDSNTYQGTVTNNYGFYSLSLNKTDTVHLHISYVGYEKQDTLLVFNKNQQINFSLMQNNMLNEIVIQDRYKNIERKTEMSTVEIPLKQIKNLPSLTGEPDIMRAFQLMPGVQSGKEGTSSISVRGGGPDQNLFLLDGVPLYYVSHIGGFVSVFEPGALKSVKLIKGGFPARYGGRLSSVVDIIMKEGNKEKLHGEYTLGILSSKFLLEGPVKNNKSSFLFSLRRCNIDILTIPISWFNSNGESFAGYTFYDINAKYNHQISKKTKIYFSFYTGRDKIFVKSHGSVSIPDVVEYRYKNIVSWGNIMGTIRFNHLYNSKLFSNTTLSYTKFNYQTKLIYKQKGTKTDSLNERDVATFNSGVQDIIAKIDYDFYPNTKNIIKFGASATYHIFTPGITVFKQTANIDTSYGSNNINAIENNLYFEDEIKISKKIIANIGLHSSLYYIQKSFFYTVQPRLMFNYLIKNNLSIKLSYANMQQHIHLLSNSGAGLPTDLWVPATKKIKPENSQQLAVGIAHTLPFEKQIELTIESYYKTMTNLIEFSEGASCFSGGSNWQEKIETDGKGTAYGIEFLLQKKEGKTTGWISYTLSKNERVFKTLNNGMPFPYRYDRRHNISIVINHKFNKNITLSATWIYETGNAITLAVYQYCLINYGYNYALGDDEFNNVHVYNGRNSSRMPAYHRFDVGINFKKQKKKGIRTWNLSIYNVYNHKNPYFLYYKYDNKKGINLYGLSLFPIIPSVSYSFKF
ncbi:MAG: TonB-dependent receptor [Bacteroidetes bacterium]|nr:TonB-dependent receptor [Bacteroidota bacterium]